MLHEVRELLARQRALPRLERAAQIWVNGTALGPASPNGYLYETYD